MITHIYIKTYGCAANQNNSEIIAGLLVQAGFDIVQNPEIADLLIVNTCIVKEPTEKKIERQISELCKLRKPLIVAGCMPQIKENQKKLSKLNNVFLLGTNNFKNIPKLIRKICDGKYQVGQFVSDKKEEKLCVAKISQNRKIGITQILEGCTGNCNYCIVRLAKGKLFSYSKDKILKSIKQDFDANCKELWLTSQDNAAYGLDKDKENLAKLLKEILKKFEKKKFKIRIGMMNPNNVLPIVNELIKVYKDKKIYKFLHLPVQSGSDKILKLMNRQYAVKDFLEIIERFKKEILNIMISTDVIVGYPGESKQDFEKTLQLIKKIKPDILNISKFWLRAGTKAAEQENRVDQKTAKKRATKLMKLHSKIALENNKKFIGKKCKCLVNKLGFKLQGRQTYLARSDEYKLVVLRLTELNKNLLGRFVNMKIIDAKPHYLLGKILPISAQLSN